MSSGSGSGRPARLRGRFGRRADRLADQRHEADVEDGLIHVDLVDTLANAERDGVALLVEDPPACAAPGFQAPAAQHEGAMVLVRELGVGVEPPVHPHVARGAGRRERAGLRDRHAGRDGEEAAHAHPRAVRAEEEAAGGDRGEAGDDHDEGGHGGRW